jgi:N-acyl-D-amino-acid deacylase
MTSLTASVTRLTKTGFVRGALLKAAVAVLAVGMSGLSARAGEPTWLLHNIRLVDGTGAPAHEASVRISGDRIVAVGDLAPTPQEKTVDGHGMVLAPGFIDSHSHHDRGMFDTPGMTAVTSQGVTTIMIGQDGFSVIPLAKGFDRLAENPVAVNVGSYTGHNSLRTAVMPDGDRKRPATPAEIARMGDLLAADIEAGSFGLGTGLGYETGVFPDRAEVLALAKVSAAHGGRYISHMRDEGEKVMSAIDEVLVIGRETGAPVQISHIKVGARKVWGLGEAVIETLDRARAEGIKVTADIYPYTYWQTTMRILFPNKDYDDASQVAKHFRDTLSPSDVYLQHYLPEPALAGKTIAEIADARGEDAVTTYMALMQKVLAFEAAHPAEDHVESIIGTSMSEEEVAQFIKWPHSNICSDGADGGHPRGYGTFTRVLGHYVREQGLLTLEEAVRKMTGLTAKNLGIADRGLIKPGMKADLVLFNPDTVADKATVDDPKALSDGLLSVWVNGALVYETGKDTGARPGQPVRPGKQAGTAAEAGA